VKEGKGKNEASEENIRTNKREASVPRLLHRAKLNLAGAPGTKRKERIRHGWIKKARNRAESAK